MTPPDSDAHTGLCDAPREICTCGKPDSDAREVCGAEYTRDGRRLVCREAPRHDADHAMQMADRSRDAREVRGTFACPICGRNTPHTHTYEEEQEYQRGAKCKCGHPLSQHTLNRALGWTRVIGRCQAISCVCDGAPPLSSGATEAEHRADLETLWAALKEATAEVERLRAGVSLPLSLAQRILAALEGNGNAAYLRALAAELRERMPK